MISLSTTTPRELFLAAARGEKTKRPPLWIMRQAGRYLPEYRALKEKYGFLGIVKTPEIGAEAALQPIRRFGFDCAIVFSDILAMAEALGFPYKFADGGGIRLERKIASVRDIENMPAPENAAEKLQYVFDNLKILRAELPDRAIFGFCASPLTLGAYMVEGASSRDFPAYANFILEEPETFKKLMEKLSAALALFAKIQSESGIDAFQIFDSHAWLAPIGRWNETSGKWSEKISEAAGERCAVALFANGMGKRLAEIADFPADIISLDSSVELDKAKALFAKANSVQGNLDPNLLSEADEKSVETEALGIMQKMSPIGGHVFNLGHGILPSAKIENVEALCQTVKNFKPIYG